jgi:ATP-dependent exoDNAse (exonuclease V) alpha subunit
MTIKWDHQGTTLARTQYPLALAWAMTIHKSQGLTLLKAIIELGPKEFAPGLSFVAISRVKTLAGLAFKSSFPLSRLQRSVTETVKMLEADTVRRENLGFELETYGMDLSEYVFND